MCPFMNCGLFAFPAPAGQAILTEMSGGLPPHARAHSAHRAEVLYHEKRRTWLSTKAPPGYHIAPVLRYVTEVTTACKKL